MGSINDGNRKEDIEEGNSAKLQGQAPFDFSTSRRILLGNGNAQTKNLQNSVTSVPDRFKFLKFGSASAKFKRLAQDRDEASRSVASSNGHHFRERISGVFAGKIDWASLLKLSKQWIRDPMNMALLVWILCVAVSGAILFLVMTGMLNGVLPKKSQRDAWFEVNNQILNALFTLMCLYQHPKRTYHLVLLCRWKEDDISRLRKIYCKNGTYKPHEWAHMMVVVVLLHVNCFAQYALCGLNWGYKRSERPPLGVGLCLSFAIAAPAIAGLYTIMSPLGRDYSEMDEEAQIHITSDESERPAQFRIKSLEKRYSFANLNEQEILETTPQWSGGIFDFWDEISLAYLSLFCTFCVFGWNMERLGFGNMYVHIATFLLFCMAPFWIFNLAAININNETVREALGITGIVLCAFGLLYGGFWRIQMRKRFNLPTYTFCFGEPAVSDFTLWLCCCWCSLAQEVRTGNAYDIVEDKFCRKHVDSKNLKLLPQLSPREDGSGPSSPLEKDPSISKLKITNSPSPRRLSAEKLATVKEENSAVGKDDSMTPPSPLQIQREAT